MRALLVTHKAEDDLRGIWIYSAETWGEAQADRYLDALAAALDACGKHPERGQPRDEARAGTWSQLAQKHVIFYRFDDTQVVVQRVLHAAMDPARHLDDL